MSLKIKSRQLKLEARPLEEVWLTIRWKLEQIGPGLQKDPQFPIALGSFASEVSSKFPHRVAKKESEAPLDFLPYIPRYQFRQGSRDGWPLLQLGPGIATVNYTQSYNWDVFLKDAIYLRRKLLEAYKDIRLEPESISLKYRNAIQYNYKKKNLFNFLNNKLHYQVKMPVGIPGDRSKNNYPLDINHSTVFDIADPRAQGIFRIATGYKKVKDKKGVEKDVEHLINDMEIISKKDDAPDYYDETKFRKWLLDAHEVVYQWFFSFVKGELLESFKK